MAKITGLGWTSITVDGSDGTGDAITNDVRTVEVAITRAQQDVTGVDMSAMERLNLLADGAVTLEGVFNAVLSHVTFRDMGSTNVVRTVALVHAAQTFSGEYLPSAYTVARTPAGELGWTVPFVLQNGTAPAWTG